MFVKQGLATLKSNLSIHTSLSSSNITSPSTHGLEKGFVTMAPWSSAPEENELIPPLLPEESWHGLPGPFLGAALQQSLCLSSLLHLPGTSSSKICTVHGRAMGI